MLRHLLETDGARSASIGTLGVLIGSAGERLPGGGGLTTPGAVELQRLLRELADSSVRTVAMEVSSHSLHQHRVDGIRYDIAVFTNFTRDHLDYHESMEAYFAAKASLLEYLSPAGTGVRNADDPRVDRAGHDAGRRALDDSSASATLNADVTARDVRYTPRGSNWTLSAFGQSCSVRLPLIGDFNVTNALAAAAAAHAAGLALETIATRLSTMPQVPGRLEFLSEQPAVLRDYAHTPDALERVLKALRPFTSGKLIVVFGAGGDRDRGKRPLMGKVAAAHADQVIVTSDNPRTEDPERIMDEIVAPLDRSASLRARDLKTGALAIGARDRARGILRVARCGAARREGARGLSGTWHGETAVRRTHGCRARSCLASAARYCRSARMNAARGFLDDAPAWRAPFSAPVPWTTGHSTASPPTRARQSRVTCTSRCAARRSTGTSSCATRSARGSGFGVVVSDAARGGRTFGVPAYVVPDTLHALGALARYYRRAWGRPVIAVGGSNGKTSTKEMLRAALGARLAVHATRGNLNNRVGVPLTLLGLPNDADIAVIEAGTNTPGEIALLRDIIEPDLALVTTVQEEHLEGFGDLAGVMREEASLCDQSRHRGGSRR